MRRLRLLLAALDEVLHENFDAAVELTKEITAYVDRVLAKLPPDQRQNDDWVIAAVAKFYDRLNDLKDSQAATHRATADTTLDLLGQRYKISPEDLWASIVSDLKASPKEKLPDPETAGKAAAAAPTPSAPSQKLTIKSVDGKELWRTTAKSFARAVQAAVDKAVPLVDADFTDQDLSGVDFSEAMLRGAVFDLAILEGANFSGADLTEASFRGATLTDANFNSTQIKGADFVGSLFNSTTMTSARGSGAKFVGAAIAGADFSFSFLAKADFSKAQVANATFDQVDLLGATFAGAKLADSTFEDSNLTDVNFTTTKLSNVSFEGSNKKDARMKASKKEASGADVLAWLKKKGLHSSSAAKMIDVVVSKDTEWFGQGKMPPRIEQRHIAVPGMIAATQMTARPAKRKPKGLLKEITDDLRKALEFDPEVEVKMLHFFDDTGWLVVSRE